MGVTNLIHRNKPVPMQPCHVPMTARPIPPFMGWTAFTPVVPDIYREAISPQQQIHDICCRLHRLTEYADMLSKEMNIDREIYDKLIADFEQFMASGFDDYYREQIEQWVRDNFLDLMKSILNQGVFFGLTDDGYFCAYEVWQLMIVFDTIASYDDDNYGKLVLTY